MRFFKKKLNVFFTVPTNEARDDSEMYCAECGGSIEDEDWNYCPWCGNTLVFPWDVKEKK